MADVDAPPADPAAEQADMDTTADIDEVWTSSRTARQIYSLGLVEKDISRLLSLAASAISLLALPQTDGPDDDLPQGDERSEQFVLEATAYFEALDRIQENLRASLAHIRHSRISPRAAMAPPPGAVPPTLGVGLPALAAAGADADVLTELGLQEGRVARDAWRGLKNALVRLQAAGAAPADQEMQSS